MKKIGFIDYYISEWHANNYTKWIETARDELGLDVTVGYAWAELDISPKDGVTTDEWCEKNGVEKCFTIEELCEKADYVLILAPSDPDTHLRYARVALSYGKNTYIDKTFAPDLATAQAIFDIAEKHGTKFFSSSALRYGKELAGYDGNALAATFTTGGSDIVEYIIHPVEMIIKTLGNGATAVRLETAGDQTLVRVSYPDGRAANVIFSAYLPYSAAVCGPDGKTAHIPAITDHFKNLIRDILRFFEEGTTSFDVRQTLEVMRLRDAVLAARDCKGEWIAVK